METVERPLEADSIDSRVGFHGEDAHLLAREAGKGTAAGHGHKAAVVGQHLYVGTGVFLGESNQVADVAYGVVFALAGGTYNCEL